MVNSWQIFSKPLHLIRNNPDFHSKMPKKKKNKNIRPWLLSFLPDPLLPEKARMFMARRTIDTVAVTLMASSFAGALSILSYAPSDPAFNVAGGGDIKPPYIEGMIVEDQYGNQKITDTAVTGFVGFRGRTQPGTEVHVYANGKEVAHVDVESDGRWTGWSSHMMKEGDYALTAVAKDWNTGNESDESEPYWVEITGAERPVVYGARDMWGDFSLEADASIAGAIMFGGTAGPESMIEVLANGEVIAYSGTGPDGGDWETGPSPESCLPPGRHKITAYAYAQGTIQSEESEPVYIEVFGENKQACEMMKNMMESGSTMMGGGMMGDSMMGGMGGSMMGGMGGSMMGGMGGSMMGGDDHNSGGYPSGNNSGSNWDGGGNSSTAIAPIVPPNSGGGSFR